ncbi:hypothetical protein [Streptomyces katrae]|uniref:hypothetical protein n=1 Tax=Streptomyces katrae TaxID=68223 RepID=UPI0004C19A06|nr:hypothetical protein [Streptomyces katrae]
MRVGPLQSLLVQPLGAGRVPVQRGHVGESARRRRQAGGAAGAAGERGGLGMAGAGRRRVLADAVVGPVDQQVRAVLQGTEPFREREGLVGERDGPYAVAAPGRPAGERVQGQGGASAVTEFAEPPGGGAGGLLGHGGVPLAVQALGSASYWRARPSSNAARPVSNAPSSTSR